MSQSDRYYYDYDDRGRYSDRRYSRDPYYDYDYYNNNDYNYSPKNNRAHVAKKSPQSSVRRAKGSWDVRDMFIAPSGGHHNKCCPHVVDPLAFLAFLAAIPVVTFFLNMQITMFIGKRKRKRNFGSSLSAIEGVGVNETNTSAYGRLFISLLDDAIDTFQGNSSQYIQFNICNLEKKQDLIFGR